VAQAQADPLAPIERPPRCYEFIDSLAAIWRQHTLSYTPPQNTLPLVGERTQFSLPFVNEGHSLVQARSVDHRYDLLAARAS